MRDLMALEEARMSQESLRAQIEQADSLFGVVAGTDEDWAVAEAERQEQEEVRYYGCILVILGLTKMSRV